MRCKICGSSAAYFGEAAVLQKHAVRFYRCGECGFIQTEHPYWLKEAYSSAITRSDLGLISRNLQMAQVTKRLILMCFDPAAEYVDYGAGYGVFVRLMRDFGFDFYRYDPLCENLFAEGFEARLGARYELLTAWEVFEHLVDPMAEIADMLRYSDYLLFSTVLLPAEPLPLGKWWYYGLEHGQHVAFYTREALAALCTAQSLRILYSKGPIHLVGRRQVSNVKIRIAMETRLNPLRKLLSARPPASLLDADYQKITGQQLQDAPVREG